MHCRLLLIRRVTCVICAPGCGTVWVCRSDTCIPSVHTLLSAVGRSGLHLGHYVTKGTPRLYPVYTRHTRNVNYKLNIKKMIKFCKIHVPPQHIVQKKTLHRFERTITQPNQETILNFKRLTSTENLYVSVNRFFFNKSNDFVELLINHSTNQP